MGGMLLMSLIRWMGGLRWSRPTSWLFGAVAVPEPIGLEAAAVVAPGAGQWSGRGRSGATRQPSPESRMHRPRTSTSGSGHTARRVKGQSPG
jgi:hypothetical protein